MRRRKRERLSKEINARFDTPVYRGASGANGQCLLDPQSQLIPFRAADNPERQLGSGFLVKGIVVSTNSRCVALISNSCDVLFGPIMESPHSGSNVASLAEFTLDLVNHVCPRAVDVANWAVLQLTLLGFHFRLSQL